MPRAMTATFHLRKAEQVLARGIRPHYVYFIVATPRDPRHAPLVKIGTTTDVDKRLSEIRRGGAKSPDWLEDLRAAARIDLAGWVKADGEVEKYLHRAFADHRVGGEWFHLAAIRDDINYLLAEHCECRGCQIDGRTCAHL